MARRLRIEPWRAAHRGVELDGRRPCDVGSRQFDALGTAIHRAVANAGRVGAWEPLSGRTQEATEAAATAAESAAWDLI